MKPTKKSYLNEAYARYQKGEFIHKEQVIYQVMNVLVPIETRFNETNERPSKEELEELTRFLFKIHRNKQLGHYYIELQDRLKALTGYRLEKIRKIANRQKHAHRFTPKGGEAHGKKMD